MLVAGVDSSTQSTKVLLCRADDGAVVGRGSAPHPDGTETDPAAWWTALAKAGDGLLEQAAAVGVAGQQHGMVVLDSGGEVIRPALLWNDLRSASAAAALIRERGDLRRPGHGARARGIRGARRGPPGGVGAGGHPGPARLATQARRRVHRAARAPAPRPVCRPPGRHRHVGRKDR